MRRTIINIILATDMCDHSRLTKVLPVGPIDQSSSIYTGSTCINVFCHRGPSPTRKTMHCAMPPHACLAWTADS